jgi:hypothetical protein
MIESYDMAMEELHEVKEQIKAMTKQDDDVAYELLFYDLIDKHICDRDVEELLLQDQEE